MKTSKTQEQQVASRANAQIRMLSAQFVLGMGENLIGKPSEVHGFSKAVSAGALGLHVLIGIGLIVSGIITIRFAQHDVRSRRLAWWGGLGVVVAFVAGMLNMANVAGQSWWSFIMALAFLEALLVYGMLYLRSQKSHRTATI